MVIASLNVNSLLFHIDEVRIIIKISGYLFWPITKQNLMIASMMLWLVLMAIPFKDVIGTVMVAELLYISKILS